MASSFLTALPVYNEGRHVAEVLGRVLESAGDVLVVNDGSKDHTAEEVARFPDVVQIQHERNRGYGAALCTAFEYALKQGYEGLVTIDCDGQHEPKLIPVLAGMLSDDVEMISGSRYLSELGGNSQPPEERMKINRQITDLLNQRLGFEKRLGAPLTDAFCGFKAYRVPALAQLNITDFGYAMPLQVWVQAAALNWRIVEVAVPRIYLEEERSFGGSLDNHAIRLRHYLKVFEDELARWPQLAEPERCPEPCPGH